MQEEAKQPLHESEKEKQERPANANLEPAANQESSAQQSVPQQSVEA